MAATATAGTAIAHDPLVRKLALVLLVFTVGCKPQSQKLADELDRSSSWLAAIAEVGRTSSQNSTPLRFSRNAVDDATDELNKSASRLAQITIASDISAVGRRLILASTAKLDELRADLDASAVDMHGNLAWLKAASDTLSDLSDRARKLK